MSETMRAIAVSPARREVELIEQPTPRITAAGQATAVDLPTA